MLFKDPDFGPESQYNPFLFQGDLKDKTLADLEYSLRKVSWMRPREIAPKPRLTGFTELNTS